MKSFIDIVVAFVGGVGVVCAAIFVGALYLSPVLVPIGLFYILFHFVSKYW